MSKDNKFFGRLLTISGEPIHCRVLVSKTMQEENPNVMNALKLFLKRKDKEIHLNVIGQIIFNKRLTKLSAVRATVAKKVTSSKQKSPPKSTNNSSTSGFMPTPLQVNKVDIP